MGLLLPSTAIRKGSLVAPIDRLSVVFVIILSAAFLGEKATVHAAIGGSLIVVGAVIIALS